MIRNRRPATLAAWAALVCIAASPAFAADELNVTRGLTAVGAPLAVHGYDPVAFFTRNAPTLGSPEHAAVYDGATYYFASRDNQEAFEADPQRYVPAFGGYCAFGVSVGKKFDADPRYWTIADGRLYLNLNAEIAKQFARDVPGAVAKAQKNWRRIEHEPVADL
jgi:YHS domain-containing protein